MPRQGRINIEAGIYHIIQRGIEHREIFKDNDDRERFIERLGERLKDTGHKCYGWVLMPNHFHLVIRTGTAPLSSLMRRLLTGYALYFNKKYKRNGYLFQGRYKSILCQEDIYLLELIRYVHLNPLRAGIVKDMEGLKKYRWSGHADLLGLQRNDWQTTGEILILFGKGKKKAVKGYEEFVEAGINICKSGCLSVGGFIRSTGGWKAAEDFERRKHAQEADDRILGDGDFVAQTLREAEERIERKEKLKKDGWGIEKAISRACELSGVSTEGIKRQSRRTKLAQAKSLAIYFANSDLGINGAELSEYFGLTPAAISVSIQRGRKIAGDNEYLII